MVSRLAERVGDDTLLPPALEQLARGVAPWLGPGHQDLLTWLAARRSAASLLTTPQTLVAGAHRKTSAPETSSFRTGKMLRLVSIAGRVPDRPARALLDHHDVSEKLLGRLSKRRRGVLQVRVTGFLNVGVDGLALCVA